MAEHIQISIRHMRGTYDQMQSREERVDLPAGATLAMSREAFANVMATAFPALIEVADAAIELVVLQVEAAEAEQAQADAAREDAARDAAGETAREPSESRA